MVWEARAPRWHCPSPSGSSVAFASFCYCFAAASPRAGKALPGCPQSRPSSQQTLKGGPSQARGQGSSWPGLKDQGLPLPLPSLLFLSLEMSLPGGITSWASAGPPAFLSGHLPTAAPPGACLCRNCKPYHGRTAVLFLPCSSMTHTGMLDFPRCRSPHRPSLHQCLYRREVKICRLRWGRSAMKATRSLAQWEQGLHVI